MSDRSIKDTIIEAMGEKAYWTFVDHQARLMNEGFPCVVCHNPITTVDHYHICSDKCLEVFRSNKVYYKRIAGEKIE
jgi:calcineurin-like phosphoesterase family protein